MRTFLLAAVLLTLGGGCSAPGDDELSGSRLYFDHCSDCHSPDGTGAQLGPSLFEEAGGFSAEQIVDVVLNGEGLMDPVNLTVEEANAVAEYLTTALLLD